MFKIIVVAVLLVLSMTANSTLINNIEYSDGLILKTGSVFFNTINTPVNGDNLKGQTTITQGVGQVTAIYDEGNLIWQNGDNGMEYNFTFDNIILSAVEGPNMVGQLSYGDIYGEIDFYANDIGTFSPTGNFLVDADVINNGILNISSIGHEVYGFSIVGAVDSDSNGGQGQLSVIGGSAFDIIVQDSLLRADGSFADMTFNFSADNINTAGYEWSGSADLAVVTNEVPTPGPLALLSAGLLGLGFTRKFV